MARHFTNDSTDRITATNLNITRYTVSQYIKGDALPIGSDISQTLRNGFTDGVWGFSWDHTSGSFKQAWFHKDAVPAFSATQISTTLEIGKWYHLIVVYDQSNVILYLDGKEEARTAVTSVFSPTGDLVIGAGIALDSFDGNVGSTAIWNTDLHKKDIALLTEGELPLRIRPDALVRYWPIYGYTSPEPDLSGNAAHGTVTGTTSAAPPIIHTPIKKVLNKSFYTLLESGAPPAANTKRSFSPMVIG